MDQGGLHCLMRFCYIAKKSLVSFQIMDSRRCVLNFEIHFPQKNVFRGFLSSGNLIVELSGAGL